MTLWVPNSGSKISSDGSIDASASGKLTFLFLISDPGAVASADIKHGSPAASLLMTLRSASGQQSPTISVVTSTCLIVDGLDSGDVIALVRT
jgi:hypothetical protein